MAREQKQEGDIRHDLEEFRALVSDRAQHASFMVLDKVVVKDWRVDVHYNIPLSRPAAPREEKVSTNLDLCNARHESSQVVISQLGHSLYWQGSVCTASPCGMARQDQRAGGVRRRAEFYYQQLDVLRLLRQ